MPRATLVGAVDLLGIERRGSKTDEVGRDPALDDELGFDHGDHPIVGECEHCGRELHEGVVGHCCDGEFRRHPNGGGVMEVPA